MISSRKFISYALIWGLAICSWSTMTLAGTSQYDLLFQGGHVIDPANHIDQIMDVAVANHRIIAAVKKDIPDSEAKADIAVLQLLHGNFCYHDDGNARMCGNSKLNNVMTVRDGAILYDPSGLSMVDWHHARPQYFGHCPDTARMVRGRRRCSSTADNFPRHITNYENLGPPFPLKPWLQVPGNLGNNPRGVPHPPALTRQYHSPFPARPRAHPLANPRDVYPVQRQTSHSERGQQ